MSSRIVSRKTVIVLGGIFVFLVGTVAGSFLVLRSSSSEGRTFLIESPNGRSGEAEGLLKELAVLQGSDLLDNYTNENLTENFLNTLISKSVEMNVAVNELGANEDFYAAAAESLKSQRPTIFPEIDERALRISEDASSKEYVKAVDRHFLFLRDAWRTVLASSPEKITAPATKSELLNQARRLSASTEAFRSESVPPQYKEFHKKVLSFS